MRRRTHVDMVEPRKPAPWWLRGLGRLAFRYRWWLVPYSIAAGAVGVGWVGAVVWRLWPGWAYTAAGVLGLVAVAWIVAELSDRYERALGAVAVLVAGGYAAAIARHPLDVELYPGGLIVATLLGIPWWFSDVMRRLVRLDRIRVRLARGKVGQVGARVLDAEETPSGTTYRVDRGDASWPEVAAAFADQLDRPAGSVLAAADKWGNKKGTVRVLNRDVFDAPEVAHPATEPGATEPGGAWAPGSRSVYDPAPIGPAPDGGEVALPLLTREGAARILIAGKSGGGKSNTFATVTAHVAACRDAVLIASDVVKGGGTFLAWEPALGGPGVPADVPALALTAEDTEQQMLWLLDEVERRCAVVARSDAPAWVATPQAPAIVYAVEEAAELFARFDGLSDHAVGLGRLVRQAGIVFALATQGTDYDSIPTRLRENLHGLILHKMEAAALKRVWKGAGSLDLGLFEQAGMLYAKFDGDGLRADEATPVRSYALYEPGQVRRLANVYERPAAGPAAETPAAGLRVEQTGETRMRNTRERAEQAAEQVAELIVNPPDMPAGPLPKLTNPEPVRTDRATLDAALSVMREARQAGEPGARAADVAVRLAVSKATALRVIAELRDMGEAVPVGQGPKTRWQAVEPAELAGVSGA